MALKGFTATTVNPGDALTAQAWNEVVGALTEVYGELAGRRSLPVRVTTAGLDPWRVRIVARHATYPPVEAIRPSPGQTDHILAGLRAGSWELHAEAEGYVPSTKSVDVAAAGELQAEEIGLQLAGGTMPDLYGDTVREAFARLRAVGIGVGEIYDVTGKSWSEQQAEQELASSKVLVQLPPAGRVVPPTDRVGLVLAAALEAVASVRMPSLVGMTLSEARRTLEAHGLVLGKAETRRR